MHHEAPRPRPPRLTTPRRAARLPAPAAIKALKERNGSSLPAIKKYIGANYKLPAGWVRARGRGARLGGGWVTPAPCARGGACTAPSRSLLCRCRSARKQPTNLV